MYLITSPSLFKGAKKKNKDSKRKKNKLGLNDAGIEPTAIAWKAIMLPLHQSSQLMTLLVKSAKQSS